MHHLTPHNIGKAHLPRHYRSTRSLVSVTRPTNYDSINYQRVTINVSGEIYETLESTLNKYPETVLGSREKRSLLINSLTRQIYFDRHRVAFEAILYYFQSSGNLIRPENISMNDFVEECLFYDISEQAVKRMKERECFLYRPQTVFPEHKVCKALWLFIDHPNQYGSFLAKFYCVLSLILILISIGVFCVESELFLWFDGQQKLKQAEICQQIELATNLYFAIELLIRFFVYPTKLLFFQEPLNVAEIISITLYLFAYGLSTYSTLRTYCLYTSRMIRCLRLTRASRLSRALDISTQVFFSSLNDIIAVVFIVLVLCIFAGSVVYYVEMDNPGTKFLSIPDSMWWSMQSLLCLGYGDIVPETYYGKAVGSCMAFLGVVTVTVLLLSLGGRLFDMYSKELYEKSFMPEEEKQDYEIHY